MRKRGVEQQVMLSTIGHLKEERKRSNIVILDWKRREKRDMMLRWKWRRKFWKRL